MVRPPRSMIFGYLAAVAAVGLATAARWGLAGYLGSRQPFVTYYIATLGVAITCGLGPSILAIVLSGAVGLLLFADPIDSLGAGDVSEMIALGLFLVTTGSIAAYSAGNRTSRRRLLDSIEEHRRAEEAIAEQARLARFGRDIGPALTRNASLREMLGGCAEVAVRHLDAAFARIWTVDESGETLELQASAGLYTHLDGDHARIPVGRFKIGRIAATRTPHLTNSVVGDPQVPAQDWAIREGMVAFAGYPLVVDDRLVGVLAVFARHPLSRAAIEMMGSVADEVAIGIERKRAERRLLEQREWLRVTLSSIGDAVIATDRGGSIVFLNPVAESLTGFSAAEAANRPLAEVFRIEDEATRRPAENPADRAKREGRAVALRGPTVLIARDGSARGISDSAAPIRDGDGATVGVVLVFRDVEEERKAGVALAESEARFRTMAESIPQLAWVARPDGHVVWYNRRWYDYTGTTPGAMQGWGRPSAHDPAGRPGGDEKFRAAIASGEPWEDTFPIRRHDGAMRQHLSRAMPSKDETGRLVCWFGTNTDITERIEMEEALRLAKREADEASEAKSRFLAVLSHELRTPLNPILLAATAMLEEPGDLGGYRPTLEMIRQNVNLQARLIDDLLDVMRIVRGKMPLHWEVADSHRLIDQAVQICRSEVFGQELGLVVDLGATRRLVNADAARLQQVLWNLVKNAVKFTPGGGGIVIRTRNEPDGDDPHGRLVFEVSDSGIGIDAEALPRIFDAFQQGETTITRRFGGLGLGLAICRGIVEAHGGLISVESPGAGKGTTFRVSLRALPNTETVDFGRPPAHPGSPGPGPMRPLSILVVEDEPATLRLMERLLSKLGHSVQSADTITRAIALYERDPFDMIISDIGLPDGSGLELMRRAVTIRGPIPAIALTGYGMEEDIRRSREAGFTAHLTKPIDFSKLGAMILQLSPARS